MSNPSNPTTPFRPLEQKTCTKCKVEKPIQKADADKKKADKAEYSKKYFTF